MKPGINPLPIESRFHANYEIITETGCWLWKGWYDKNGYGMMKIGHMDDKSRRNEFAHRVSWIIHHGHIPKGLFVLHHCDTPCCVNPHHLFLGTQTDNMQDASKKQRIPMGDRSNLAKLTEGQVISIRESHDKPKILANKFKVTRNNIYLIKSNQTWRYLGNKAE
jgi:hypothetical protein